MTAIAEAPTATKASAKPKSKKKLFIVIAVVLAIAGGGAYFFVLKPAGPSTPQPGAVAPLTDIQVNLQGGHYLRLGIALQETQGAPAVDGSKALDAAISVFSGRSVAELLQPAGRERLKKQLVGKLDKLYSGQVMDVYFTDFVTQ
ncbi:MAG: flagellar basal body-associated FliL family protein [Nocardioidaceae bacterium]